MQPRALVGSLTALGIATMTSACGQAAPPEAPVAVLVVGQSPPQDAPAPSARESLDPPSTSDGQNADEIETPPTLVRRPPPPGTAPVRKCKQLGGPTGSGGQVQSAVVDDGGFPGTPAAGCIALQFRNARVPPFCGGAVITIGKSFSLN